MKVAAIMKYQLIRGWTGTFAGMPGTPSTADLVIPASNASVPATKRFAVKPPEAAA